MCRISLCVIALFAGAFSNAGTSGGSGGPTPGDPGGSSEFEQWTDREYVYDPSGDLGGVDQFIQQIDRIGTPIDIVLDANLNLVGLFGLIGVSTQMLRQDVYAPCQAMQAALRLLHVPLETTAPHFCRPLAAKERVDSRKANGSCCTLHRWHL